MKKELLINGSVVELRNGYRCLYVDGTLLCLGDDLIGKANCIEDYDDDLCSLFDFDFDIVKIHNNPICSIGLLNNSLKDVFCENKWLWVRDNNNCDNCNIVESFSETMLLVLELLGDGEYEEAKEVVKNFLDEKK